MFRTARAARGRGRERRRRRASTTSSRVALSDVGAMGAIGRDDRDARSRRARATGGRDARARWREILRVGRRRVEGERAREGARTRARGRVGDAGGDIAIRRAVGGVRRPRRRGASTGRRDGVARRDERASSRARGASNGRAARAPTRGRRRSRARGVDKPPAWRGGGGRRWVATRRARGRATKSVESTARGPRLTERARVFFVLFTVVHWPHLYRPPHQGGANFHRSRRAPNRHQGDWREDRRGDEG